MTVRREVKHQQPNIVVSKLREQRFLRRRVVAYFHFFTLSINFFSLLSLSKVMRPYIAIFATFERLEIYSKLPFYGFVTPKLKRNLMVLKERVKIFRLATTLLL